MKVRRVPPCPRYPQFLPATLGHFFLPVLRDHEEDPRHHYPSRLSVRRALAEILSVLGGIMRHNSTLRYERSHAKARFRGIVWLPSLLQTLSHGLSPELARDSPYSYPGSTLRLLSEALHVTCANISAPCCPSCLQVTCNVRLIPDGLLGGQTMIFPETLLRSGV